MANVVLSLLHSWPILEAILLAILIGDHWPDSHCFLVLVIEPEFCPLFLSLRKGRWWERWWRSNGTSCPTVDIISFLWVWVILWKPVAWLRVPWVLCVWPRFSWCGRDCNTFRSWGGRDTWSGLGIFSISAQMEDSLPHGLWWKGSPWSKFIFADSRPLGTTFSLKTILFLIASSIRVSAIGTAKCPMPTAAWAATLMMRRLSLL